MVYQPESGPARRQLIEANPACLLAYHLAAATLFAAAQRNTLEKTERSLGGCIPGMFDGIALFTSNYAQLHKVEMGSHAVATGSNDPEILCAPVGRAVPVDGPLPSSVLHSRKVKQHMLRRQGHKRYPIFELITRAEHLMLI